MEKLPMTSSCEKKSGCRFILVSGAAVALLLSACGSSTPPDTRAADEKVLRDMDAQWSKAAASNNLDAVVAYYTDDASLLPPNEPIADNKQAIRASWAGFLVPGTSVSWEANRVDVSRSSDLAYTQGTYQATMKDAQGKLAPDHGKYLEVWKKQADGKWKAVADMFSSDVAAAPASAEKKAPAKGMKRHSRARRRSRRA
jgi:ketosteroid isomerase-like protein